MGKNAKREPKPRIQGVVLKTMKGLYASALREQVMFGRLAIDGTWYASGFLAGYAALRSLVNPRPINSSTRAAFMKWAVK